MQHSLALCPGCGAFMGSGEPHCSVCERQGPALPVPRSDYVWAVFASSFTCRACGFLSPINHVDVDGTVVCAHCDLAQAFDPGRWRELLDYAHAAADFGSPQAEERASRADYAAFELYPFSHARPGQWLSETFPGSAEQQSVRIGASAGRPVCASCQVPQDVYSAETEGQIMMVCPSCDTRITYALPDPFPGGGLVAAIAEEHRVDRRAAEIEGTGAALAIKCPSCQGALSAAGESRIIACPYCETSCYIPLGSWQAMRQGEVQEEPFWLCFFGPSEARRRREEEHLEEERQRARYQHQAAQTCHLCRSPRASGTPCEVCGDGKPAKRIHPLAIAGIGAGIFAILLTVALVLVLTRVPSPPGPRPSPSQRGTLRCTPTSPSFCIASGRSVERRSPKEAERLYTVACEGGSGMGCYNAGVMAWRRNDRALSEKLQIKACNLGYATACGNVAGILAHRKDPKGQAVARKGCDLGSGLACSNLAFYLHRAGKTKEAAKVSRRGCDKGSVHACCGLCDYLLELRRDAAALRAGTRAVEMDDRYHAAHRCVGLVLTYQGEIDDAVRSLRKARDRAIKQRGPNASLEDRPPGLAIVKDLRTLAKEHPKRAKYVKAVLRLRKRWDP